MTTGAMSRDNGDIPMTLDEPDIRRLRVYNLVVGIIHLVQGIAMLSLSTDFALPVTRGFLTGPPSTAPVQEA